MKKTKNNKIRIWIAAFIVLFVILYLCIYIVPTVSDIFVTTYRAEYGTLEIGEESEFLVVRDEKLYTSENSGDVDRVISAGELMRKNSKIVTVGTTAYYSQSRGIISYYYDGLETVYIPDGMETITESALNTKDEQGEEKNPVKNCVEESAQPGSPIFKVVDNKMWYIICWLTDDQIEGFEVDKSISVKFSDETYLQMVVSQINPQGEKNQIILSCDRYYKDFDKIRTGTCKLIKSNKSGLLLETDSIVEEDGQKGVYVVSILGTNKFVPIKILSSQGDVTVVEKNLFTDSEGNQVETVESYDEILRIKKVADDQDEENQKQTEDKTEETKGSEQDAN